eukprot:Tamp_11197.p1 GENE.Tamp_11197~~Tamp_11197.p1  ORF type:complete len:306 (-),score=55.27 Tamp_11197:551-1468(-)
MAHPDMFDPGLVEELGMMFEDEDCEEIVERDTDKLVRISKTSDEWTLRPADRSGACQLGWEVGLAVASGTHYRLGAESPLSMLGDTDLLIEVLKLVPLVVPDHCETLKQAVEVAFPGQHILIRKGEFNVAANPGEEAVTEGGRGIGHTVLDVFKSVHLRGERGTILRGMLVFKESAVHGSVRNLTVQDAGQSCILCETGKWSVEDCFLMCGHASALKATGSATVQLRRCRLGGEGEIGQAVAEEYELPRQWVDTAGSVQEYGLRKHACYGVFVKDDAEVSVHDSEVSLAGQCCGIYSRAGSRKQT